MPDAVVIGLAWFLAWLFVVAGSHKLRSPHYYAEVVQAQIPGLPGGMALVWLIAAAELGTAAALVVPATRVTGLLGSTALLLAYTGLLIWQLASGRTNLRCGCSGPASSLTISKELVLRNSCCVVLAATALVPAVRMPNTEFGAGLSIYVATFLIILYLTSEQLIANAQQTRTGM